MRLKSFNIQIGSQLFKSLGDESRIRILNLLLEYKELSITDLEQILDFSQTKTSRHLIYLKNSGILKSHKKDQWSFYTINPEVIEQITTSMSFMSIDPQLIKDIEIYKIMF